MAEKKVLTLYDVALTNKRVILRVDYNVPIKNGVVSSEKRILASIPTIKYILEQNCSIIILSHLSRIEKIEDITSNKNSLLIVLPILKKLLPDVNIKFVKENIGTLVDSAVRELKHKEILLLENTRYNDFDIKTNTLIKKESKADTALGNY
jgi:phosphoglycerate kinase